jgi:hypothetical protein
MRTTRLIRAAARLANAPPRLLKRVAAIVLATVGLAAAIPASVQVAPQLASGEARLLVVIFGRRGVPAARGRAVRLGGGRAAQAVCLLDERARRAAHGD